MSTFVFVRESERRGCECMRCEYVCVFVSERESGSVCINRASKGDS